MWFCGGCGKEVTGHTTDKIIKHKVGLLKLAEELDNVSKVCQVMGYSRDTFYRYKAAVDDGGVEALIEKNRKQGCFRTTVWLTQENSSG